MLALPKGKKRAACPPGSESAVESAGQHIRFVLNDQDIVLGEVAPTLTLLDFLRLQRRLTGTKEGCAEGDCGACTVLVGRLSGERLVYESINACIRFVPSLHGSHVVTVEYLADGEGQLHPVQQAMVDCHGSQCGFCTPGIVMSLYALWLSDPAPTREAIEYALQGNLCRCTGYEAIVKAAERAAGVPLEARNDALARAQADIVARLKAIRAAGQSIVVEQNGARAILPGSLSELGEILAREPGATIVAGATDVGLWVTKQMRPLNPLVFIGHLSQLQAVSSGDDGIMIGAGVSYSAAQEVLARQIAPLASLLTRIGGAQIRNAGTIGGNIANGSPIGDTPPPLIALGARLFLRSKDGTRSMPLEEFFIAYGKQDRQAGEFVERIFVPRPQKDAQFAVYKVSKRRDEDISALCGAFHLTLDGAGRVASIRIAFGGMAATPKRAKAVEAALQGRPWSDETIESARDAFDDDFSPLDDWRASAAYRSLAAKNLLTRFFLQTQGVPGELRRFNPAEA